MGSMGGEAKPGRAMKPVHTKRPREAELAELKTQLADIQAKRETLADAEVMVTSVYRSRDPPAPNLRLLQCSSTGIERIDVKHLPRGCIVTRARCKVWRGSDAELAEQQQVAKADVDRRRATQPLGLPNSGSVFVNPKGDFAGRLIEQAGLKGTTRGGAQISDRHANFIVNLGRATAANVVELIALARATVLAKAGVELKPEVRLVGDFDPPLPAELEPHHLQPAGPDSAKSRQGARP